MILPIIKDIDTIKLDTNLPENPFKFKNFHINYTYSSWDDGINDSFDKLYV